MGPLLDDLQRKMQKKVDDGDKEQLKLFVYSTHDTALAGLLSSLDVFDHR
jgi:acid phosphatase